jgi:hypothetical protein
VRASNRILQHAPVLQVAHPEAERQAVGRRLQPGRAQGQLSPQLPGGSPLLQLVGDQGCQLGQGPALIRPEAAGDLAKDAHRAEAVSVMGADRGARIESYPWTARDIGIVGEAGITAGILDHEHSLLEDGV